MSKSGKDGELARLSEACGAASKARNLEEEQRLLGLLVPLSLEVRPELALSCLARQADICAQLNDLAGQVGCCEQRVELSRRLTGVDSAEMVGAQSQLASSYVALGRIDAADRALRSALSGLRGPVELYVALLEFQANLGDTLPDPARGLELRERALQIRTALFDGTKDRGRFLVIAQRNLAEAHRRVGNLDQADELLSEVLNLSEYLGPDELESILASFNHPALARS